MACCNSRSASCSGASVVSDFGAGLSCALTGKQIASESASVSRRIVDFILTPNLKFQISNLKTNHTHQPPGVMLCAALTPVAEEEIVAAVGAQAAVIDSIRTESTVNQLPDVGAIQIQMAFPALLLSR